MRLDQGRAVLNFPLLFCWIPMALSAFVGHSGAPGSKPTVRLLAIGDSLTEGMTGAEHDGLHPYAEQLLVLATEAKANIEVVEEGQTGELVVPTMTDRCKRLLANAQAAGKEFTHVFILGGLNDINWGRKAEDIFQGLMHMYKEAEAHGAHVIGMTVMEYAMEAPALQGHDDVRMELNALIRQHFETYSQGQGESKGRLTLVDLDKLITRSTKPQDPTDGQTYYNDVLHLTAAGYRHMARLLWDAVLKAALNAPA